MKHIKSILVATDLSDNSRRGLVYGCALAADNQATLTLLHVANEFLAWEHFSDESGFAYRSDKAARRPRPRRSVFRFEPFYRAPFIYHEKLAAGEQTHCRRRGRRADRRNRGRRTGRSGDHVAPARLSMAPLAGRQHHRPGDAPLPLPGIIGNCATTVAQLARTMGAGIVWLAAPAASNPERMN